MLALLLTLLAPQGVPALDRPILLPQARTSFGAAVVGNQVYLYGGHSGAPHEYDAESTLSDLLVISFADAAPPRLLARGAALQSPALVADGERLILIGGMTPLNAPGNAESLRSSADCQTWDLAAQKWSALPPLPAPRSSHDAVLSGRTLIVAGGWNLQPDAEPVWHTSVCLLDLDNPAAGWREIAAPFQRRGLAVASAAGKIWVIGGMTNAGKMSSRVDALDPQSGEWTIGPSFPGFGFGLAACALNGRIHASGRDGSLYRLNPSAGTWETAGTLLFPRFFHRLLPTADGRLLAIGGRALEGPALLAEFLDPDGTASGLRLAAVEFQAPSSAKNRQTLILRGETLQVLGGNLSLAQHDFHPEDFSAERLDLHLPSLTTRLAEMPAAFQSASAIVFEEPAASYALGGFGHDGESERALPAIYQLQATPGNWTRHAAALPTPRTQFAAVTLGARAYLFGGWDFVAGEGDNEISFPLEVLSWDPAAESAPVDTGWRLPRPRRAFAGERLGDVVYLVGGMGNDFATVTATDVLDLRSGAWSEGPALPQGLVGAQLIRLEDRLFLMGGSWIDAAGKAATNQSLWELDAAAAQWRTLAEELPIGMRHALAVAYRGRILVLRTHFSEAGRASLAWIEPGVRLPLSEPDTD
jgi:N-acetylneuraminic acid mutarotase